MVHVKQVFVWSISLSKPLVIILKSCITKCDFPHNAIVVPVHKKNEKQTLKNYRPISLLPISGKMFERTICKTMFERFTANNLILPNRSGFKPGNSCITQTLSITQKIYQSFDNGEIWGVFLEISNVFKKVWHDGLIFKLSKYGIPWNISQLVKSFLKNRK